MRWCRRCVLPDTRPNLVIGPDGVCNACRSHATKPTIDWEARARAFAAVVRHAQERAGAGHDCLIPVSGGKDSTWQVVTCLAHGLTPLCVTWRPPGRTELGEANLRNLIGLGVDHMDVTLNPAVERRFTWAALERFGTPALPMHMALFAIPLTLAARFGIPLVVWGENSAFEYGGTEDEARGHTLDAAWLAKFGVMHGTQAADWQDEFLTERRLALYRLPSAAALAAAGTRAVFLGTYFPWDPATTTRVATAHGFRSRAEGPRTGYYAAADIDDAFIAVHHWLKWYKFGFTRLFDNLSLEVRHGRLTREAAVAIIAKTGDETPHADIDRFCAFLGVTTTRFFATAERFRNPAVWRQEEGVWRIPDFLIPDWRWG